MSSVAPKKIWILSKFWNRGEIHSSWRNKEASNSKTTEESFLCLHFHVFLFYCKTNLFIITTCIVCVCISETFALIMSLSPSPLPNLLLATFSFQWNLWNLQIMTSSASLRWTNYNFSWPIKQGFLCSKGVESQPFNQGEISVQLCQILEG